ncbi:hypothetical protein K505DRAFT_334247, partial [Melanomma pulvis-pyrius CBS 109.77]
MGSLPSAKASMEFLKSLPDILHNRHYSDFEIICGDDTYHVHKAVITALSRYFRNAVHFGKEAEDNKVTLEGDDPEMVRLMVTYMYHFDYSPDEVVQPEIEEYADPVGAIEAETQTANDERQNVQIAVPNGASQAPLLILQNAGVNHNFGMLPVGHAPPGPSA